MDPGWRGLGQHLVIVSSSDVIYVRGRCESVQKFHLRGPSKTTPGLGPIGVSGPWSSLTPQTLLNRVVLHNPYFTHAYRGRTLTTFPMYSTPQVLGRQLLRSKGKRKVTCPPGSVTPWSPDRCTLDEPSGPFVLTTTEFLRGPSRTVPSEIGSHPYSVPNYH